MPNDKIAVLIDNLTCIATSSFHGTACINFIDSAWGLCKDNCETRLTSLLSRFTALEKQNLPTAAEQGRYKVCIFLEKYIRLIRSLNIVTEDQCIQLMKEEDLNVISIDELICNIERRIKFNSPDIKMIATSLIDKTLTAEKFVVGYTRISSSDILEMPGFLVVGEGVRQEVHPVPVNVRGYGPTDTWLVSTVTSNLDEDRLMNKNQKKTTMSPRGKLYPIFARVTENNLYRLKELLPNCGRTCIPGMECEIKVAFPSKKGE